MISRLGRRLSWRLSALVPLLAVLAGAGISPVGAARPGAVPRLAAISREADPLPETRPVELPLGTCGPADGEAGEWRFVSDLPWRSATTGWPAVTDEVQPERDVSFSRNPIVLMGTAYDKGIGTFPPSSIVYELGGRYSSFAAIAGINDDAPPGAGAVFQVYADGVLVHNTGPLRAHEPPAPIELCVAGVQRLSLVVAAEGERAAGRVGLPADAAGAVPVWAGARLFAPAAVNPSAAGAVREQLGHIAEARRTRVIGEIGAYAARGHATLDGLSSALPAAGDTATRHALDGDGIVLANRYLAITLGAGGPHHARLSVLDRARGALVVDGAASAVAFSSGTLNLSAATVPAAEPSFDRVDDPGLGPGTAAHLKFAAAENAALTGDLRVTLYDNRPTFTYAVALDEGWPEAPLGLEYLSAGGAAFVLGDGARVAADASLIRDDALDGDGVWRQLRVGGAKPAVAWGEAVPGADGTPGCLVFAALDEQRYPGWLVTRRGAGRAAATLGFAQPLADPDAPADAAEGSVPAVVGPRLYVELASTSDLRSALAGYRNAAGALYPAAPLPAWVRYQWGSWWTYGSAVNEVGLRRQIDTIAERLGDLGPWHIIIDAGWQDVGPDGSGDLAREVPDKFSGGLRALVEYAHSRGVRVLLYYSAVYAHDGGAKGEWLGIPRWVSSHAAWFRPLTEPGVRPARYVYDYANPETRAYLADSVRRYVVDHGADGVKIDGLGDVEGHLIPFWERRQVRPDRWAVTPVMDIYRLVWESVRAVKADAFVESGWANPATAQPYAHTFRSGDEWNRFDNAYPFPGLEEHFTYAAVQRALLGQRPNVGAIFGGLEHPLAHQWLGAALGLGAHVSLAGDLRVLSPQHLAQLRGLLVHYRPFEGVTRTGGGDHGLAPEWSATTLDTPTGSLTFLAALNREGAERTVGVDLAEAGVPAPAGDHAVFDPESGALTAARGAVDVRVPTASLRLLVLRETSGVLWTASSYRATPIAGGWRLELDGPAEIDGRLVFYSPGAGAPAVMLDGSRLAPSSPASPPGAEGFTFDPATGLLTVGFYHRGTRTVEITR